MMRVARAHATLTSVATRTRPKSPTVQALMAWITIRLHSSPPLGMASLVGLTAPIITTVTTVTTVVTVMTREATHRNSGWDPAQREEDRSACNPATGVKEGIPRDSKLALRATSLPSNAWLLANTNTSTTIEWH